MPESLLGPPVWESTLPRVSARAWLPLPHWATGAPSPSGPSHHSSERRALERKEKVDEVDFKSSSAGLIAHRPCRCAHSCRETVVQQLRALCLLNKGRQEPRIFSPGNPKGARVRAAVRWLCQTACISPCGYQGLRSVRWADRRKQQTTPKQGLLPSLGLHGHEF